MLARGFDPHAKDKDGVTALHRAAMAGHPDAVKVLLAFGAPVDALDGMFSAPPLIWAVEGRGHAQPGSDHVAVARLLIDAGSPLEWTPPPASPGRNARSKDCASSAATPLEPPSELSCGTFVRNLREEPTVVGGCGALRLSG